MVTLGVGTLVSLTLVAAASAAPPPANQPTFTRDVAPILYGHCTGCHRSGEVAEASPLVTYGDAAARAASIKDQVEKRLMPPWPADSSHSVKMRNDPRLSAADIDTIVRWVRAGAPEGLAAELIAVPPAQRKWLHPQGIPPDVVLTLPEVSLAANGEVPYVEQRVKVPLAHDGWVVAMQVRPGNYAVVHHMGITEVALAPGVTPDQLDAFAKAARQLGIPDGSLATQQPAVTDPTQAGYDMFAVYTPGTTFEMYESGVAKRLKAGDNMYINFNLHYTTTGKPERARSELALWFQSAPPAHQIYREPAAVNSIIANGRELLTDDPGTKAEGTPVAIPPIPPFADNYELIGISAYTSPVTIYQLQPHAHMRAKDFTYSVVYPDGRTQTVLTVPHYDFHWQLAYDLERPLRVPAGAKLVVTAHYDNSVTNAHLREPGSVEFTRNCGPDKQAYFRRENQSWNEMFSPFAQYSHDDVDPRRAGATEARLRSRIPLVTVVGCLGSGGKPSWFLTDASAPHRTRTQSTSAAEVKASAAMAGGAATYELLGAEPFVRRDRDGERVAVKGVLIRDGGRPRINVTSLQRVGECR